jgi:hypothetical protein
MNDDIKDDEIEDLYKPDWLALIVAAAITTIALEAFAFLMGYLT